MDLNAQVLADELEQLKASTADERLMRTATLAEDLESLLADFQWLAEAAHRIAELANRKGCDALVGASELGNRLAGAAIAQAANGLRAHDTKSAPRHVLVLDGMYVTGSQIDRAAKLAADSGAGEVSAAVLLSAVTNPKIRIGDERLVDVVGV